MADRGVFTVVYWHPSTEGARVYETLGWLLAVFMASTFWAIHTAEFGYMDGASIMVMGYGANGWQINCWYKEEFHETGEPPVQTRRSSAGVELAYGPPL